MCQADSKSVIAADERNQNVRLTAPKTRLRPASDACRSDVFSEEKTEQAVANRHSLLCAVEIAACDSIDCLHSQSELQPVRNRQVLIYSPNARSAQGLSPSNRKRLLMQSHRDTHAQAQPRTASSHCEPPVATGRALCGRNLSRAGSGCSSTRASWPTDIFSEMSVACAYDSCPGKVRLTRRHSPRWEISHST